MDDDRAYIAWTVVNWITVFLMVTLGFLVLGAVAQAAQNLTRNMNAGNGNG